MAIKFRGDLRIIEERTIFRLTAVNVQTDNPEFYIIEWASNRREGSELFQNEEHGFTPCEGCGNQVGNSFCSGREVLPRRGRQAGVLPNKRWCESYSCSKNPNTEAWLIRVYPWGHESFAICKSRTRGWSTPLPDRPSGSPYPSGIRAGNSRFCRPWCPYPGTGAWCCGCSAGW
jgi:hypothetical protein